MRLFEVSDVILERIVVYEGLIAQIFATLISGLCTLSSLRMWTRGPSKRSIFVLLLLIESITSLIGDLLDLGNALAMVARHSTTADPSCGPWRLTFGIISHCTLTMHLVLGLARAGIFQPLFIRAKPYATAATEPLSEVRIASVRQGKAVRALHMCFGRGWEQVPTDLSVPQVDRALVALGYVLEMLRRVLLVALIIGYPIADTLFHVFGCKLYGDALEDVTPVYDAGVRYWRNVFRFWNLIFLAGGLFLALYVKVGLHVLKRRKEVHPTVDSAIYAFAYLDRCINAQVRAVALIVVSVLILPQLPLYLGTSVLGFVVRLHFALQIAYFHSLSKLLGHSTWLRDLVLGPLSPASAAFLKDSVAHPIRPSLVTVSLSPAAAAANNEVHLAYPRRPISATKSMSHSGSAHSARSVGASALAPTNVKATMMGGAGVGTSTSASSGPGLNTTTAEQRNRDAGPDLGRGSSASPRSAAPTIAIQELDEPGPTSTPVALHLLFRSAGHSTVSFDRGSGHFVFTPASLSTRDSVSGTIWARATMSALATIGTSNTTDTGGSGTVLGDARALNLGVAHALSVAGPACYLNSSMGTEQFFSAGPATPHSHSPTSRATSESTPWATLSPVTSHPAVPAGSAASMATSGVPSMPRGKLTLTLSRARGNRRSALLLDVAGTVGDTPPSAHSRGGSGTVMVAGTPVILMPAGPSLVDLVCHGDDAVHGGASGAGRGSGQSVGQLSVSQEGQHGVLRTVIFDTVSMIEEEKALQR
ncbi:hypothetical protein AMAG_04463 [Allomyces macrogynus ATCC 38327]|uniref:Uncharacterized protein n=1 Tax=Allomyces macrogynus (strain ATCC 38327) TaxID=578462 RepID=A0A0L0S940_ALLM3|nr:hypothetical protein AMAG_04463 [Allomyces macrogynus ATCC 38327]|eukprot:KNE58929.1 hypothetical protein AMAG_04463 [Allomyces macrogynus ATCC 38327]